MADNQQRGNLGKFILGGIFGAVIGILVAPKSGSELRATLSQRSEAWRTRAGEVADTVRGRVGPAVNVVRQNVRPTAESVRERVTPLIEQVTSRVRGGHNGHEADIENEPQAVMAGDKAGDEESSQPT